MPETTLLMTSLVMLRPDTTGLMLEPIAVTTNNSTIAVFESWNACLGEINADWT